MRSPGSSDLNPESWSIADEAILVKSGFGKGVRDEEEVHGSPDRYRLAAGARRNARGRDHPVDGDL